MLAPPRIYQLSVVKADPCSSKKAYSFGSVLGMVSLPLSLAALEGIPLIYDIGIC